MGGIGGTIRCFEKIRVVVAIDLPLIKVQGFVAAGLDLLLPTVLPLALWGPLDIASPKQR